MEIRRAETRDMEAIFSLRVEVFVKEQNVPPEIELDAEDAHAWHFIAEENGIAVGCARVLTEEGSAHIGRLAVKREYRGHGVGSAICRFLISDCRERGYSRIWLNSQLHAVGFYQALGFRPQGDAFWEAGIEHVRMELEPAEKGSNQSS